MMFSVASPGNFGEGGHDNASARKSLAAVVVGIADQVEGHALARNAPKLCPLTRQANADRAVRQSRRGRSGARFSCESMVPTVRLPLRIGMSIATFSLRSSAG